MPVALLALLLGLIVGVSAAGAATIPTTALVPPDRTGWSAGTVYTAAGPTVYQVSGAGEPIPFVTLACAQLSGVTFDEVGFFAHPLVVTCVDGAVYTVSPDGTATLLATSPTGLEAPVVVRAGLPYAGLVMASDALGQTWTASPAGDVQQLLVESAFELLVTGGGTVVAAPTFPTTIASFGLNAMQAVSFTGGTGTGRILYDRHANVAGSHVNAPVVLVAGTAAATPTPNGTGGSATLVADCTMRGAECPPGVISVLVYVEDNADSGAGADVFLISFCAGVPSLPAPTGCSAAEGGVLRTGNVQLSSGQ